jgi:putative hydrolase
MAARTVDIVPEIPFGFALPGGQPPDPSDPQQMQQFMAQLQQLLVNPGGGPVNWDLARQIAASQLGAQGDPAVTPSDRNAVEEALRLADLWLEPASALPSGIHASVAWNRNEWIYKTLDVWRRLCDPVASRMVGAMSDLVPPEARAQLGPVQSMVAGLGGALFGGQLGQALASLATEVLSAGDIGLPLGPAGTAALVPANIREYGQGLELPEDEVRLYVALREAAHQRLFEHVPWLRGHVLTAVETYASGITVDRQAIEEAMERVDPTNPESLQAMAVEGIFTPEDSATQKASLARLETTLALVEGWVCHVVDAAARDRLPNVVRLSEAFRRRRAAGGPAEQTFAALVGLELRPRRLREAAALWAALTEHRGIAGRDAVWGHPDLIPSDSDFADPTGFARSQLELGDLANLGDFDFGDRDDDTGESRPG